MRSLLFPLLLIAGVHPAIAEVQGAEVQEAVQGEVQGTEARGAAEQKVAAQAACPAYLNHEFRKLHSSESVNLCDIAAGKPVLFINTASNCGFTPQFKALEQLNKEYGPKGLVLVGFPSDDFFQEENDEKDTAKVCYLNYGVTFTMLATSAVRGNDANPVFEYLGDKAGSPKWNFYKYLVSADGSEVKAFNSRVKPDSLELKAAIEALLPKAL